MWPSPTAVRAAPSLLATVLLGVALLAAWRLWPQSGAAFPRELEAAAQHRLVAQVRMPRTEDAALLSQAREHEAQGRLAEAVQVYEQLAQRRPDDTGALLDLAVAMGMARPQGLRGSPERLLERVLQLEPGHPQALALLGDAAFDDHNYTQAAARWRELLDRLPAGSPMAQDIQERLLQAMALDRPPGRARPDRTDLNPPSP